MIYLPDLKYIIKAQTTIKTKFTSFRYNIFLFLSGGIIS